LDRFTDGDRDGGVGAAEPLRETLRPDPLRAQMTIGMIGTSASTAMRAAPDLNSLISKLRLIVASGYTPTSSPRRKYSTAAL
jgi:hypothetical protein